MGNCQTKVKPSTTCLLCFFVFRDTQEFETSFSFACPKFLSPVAPNYDTSINNVHKASNHVMFRYYLASTGRCSESV